VTVTKDGEGDRLTAAAAYYPDGSETALTDVPTFENKKQYTMPDTGGSGTLPFTFGGIGLMLTAGVLLHKKRHDENA
jgi:LPXTG-motif cell wall-anchored protein